jgi:hypothetical protein
MLSLNLFPLFATCIGLILSRLNSILFPSLVNVNYIGLSFIAVGSPFFIYQNYQPETRTALLVILISCLALFTHAFIRSVVFECSERLLLALAMVCNCSAE